MSLKNDYNPGDKVLAADLNDAVDAVINNQHNILELYLENYFSNKNTPFQGLWFDGFSDTNKAINQNGSMVSGASGSNEVVMTNQTERDKFSIGDLVHISDASSQEINTVAAKTSGNVSVYSESNMSSFTYTETDPNGTYSDGGVVSGKRRLTMVNGGDDTTGNAWGKFAKTFNVTNGVTYTIAFDKDLVQNDAGMANRYETDVIIDGVNKGALGGPATGTQTYTHTASGSTMTIELKTHRSVTGLNGYTVIFDFYNFVASYTGYKLQMTSNLANTYGTGSVRHTSATIEDGNKRLAMTTGIGNLKKTIYQSVSTVFTQLMAGAKCWLMRKPTLQLHPNNSIAQSATQTTVNTVSGSFINGDLIDVYVANKTVRERKTVSNVSESGGGALTLGNYASGQLIGGNSATVTFSKTVASGSNRCLVVGVINRDDNVSPTGVTFNGVALTKVDENLSGGSATYSLSIWKLDNPAVTTANVVVTFAANKSYVHADAYDFSNFRGFSTAFKAASAGNHTDNIESESNGMVIEYVVHGGDPQGTTMTTGQTSRSNRFEWTAASKTSTGNSTAMGYTYGNGGNSWRALGICVLGLNPDITLTFSPAISKVGGFTTADYVERVDVKPQISLVGASDAVNYQDLTFAKAVDVIVDGETYTEDEYSYTPAAAKESLKVKLELTRGNTGLTPYAKRLGISLNT